MKFYLKTKEECDAIVASNDAFYKADRVIEGQNVTIYDYRLASLSDFMNDEAFELRGLCFVKQSDGSWKRNILMNKFFNVNQTEGWMYDDVKDKEIVDLANKEDGSIISFVEFENGNVRAKSKTSFESDQAKMAQTVYDNSIKLQDFIKRNFNANMTAIFELVSPENQIVLEYQNTELILLQIRNNETGEYIPSVDVFSEQFNIKVAEQFPKSLMNLDDLLSRKEIDDSDIEGWIVTFADGQMAKIKTDKYLQLHGLVGPDAFRENLLIETIIDGNIDDVISSLVPGEKKNKIIDLSEKVEHKFNHLVVEFKELRGSYFNEFSENRKDFAIKHSKNPLFGYVMKTLNTSFKDVEKTSEGQVAAYILKATNSLGKAKEWLTDL